MDFPLITRCVVDNHHRIKLPNSNSVSPFCLHIMLNTKREVRRRRHESSYRESASRSPLQPSLLSPCSLLIRTSHLNPLDVSIADIFTSSIAILQSPGSRLVGPEPSSVSVLAVYKLSNSRSEERWRGVGELLQMVGRSAEVVVTSPFRIEY